MKTLVGCIFSLAAFFGFFYMAGTGWAPHLTQAFPGFANIMSNEFYFLIGLGLANAFFVAPIFTLAWNLVSPIKTPNIFEAILTQVLSLALLSTAAFYLLYSSRIDHLVEFVRLFVGLESISICISVVIDHVTGESVENDNSQQSGNSVLSTAEPSIDLRNILSYIAAAFTFSVANCLLIAGILLVRGIGPANLVGWDNIVECALGTWLAVSICGTMFFTMGRSFLASSRASFSSDRIFEGSAYTLGASIFLVILTAVVCVFAAGDTAIWPLIVAAILMVGSNVLAGTVFAVTRDNINPPPVSMDRYNRLYG